MPNAYFEFKQFRVEQDRCAMKVSTDACIQGAWLAEVFKPLAPKTVLDIGAGTGLLSLILAQELEQAHITAIEINEAACLQARENMQRTEWKDRMQVVQAALQDIDNDRQYDAIICNPPFFHNHLESQDTYRNMARHSHTLSKEVLAEKIAALLVPEGRAGILYPVSEWDAWLQLARQNGLYLQQQLWVKPHEGKAPNRAIGVFVKAPVMIPENITLCIYERGTRQYTPECTRLLEPYYLNL